MLIALVFRAHRLATKPRAYRRDYCCTCEGEQLSIQWRSFVLLHLYFIPLLPLGFWREWRCKQCGQDPAFRENTWARILRVGGVLFGAGAIWVTVGICSEALERGHRSRAMRSLQRDARIALNRGKHARVLGVWPRAPDWLSHIIAAPCPGLGR